MHAHSEFDQSPRRVTGMPCEACVTNDGMLLFPTVLEAAVTPKAGYIPSVFCRVGAACLMLSDYPLLHEVPTLLLL
jgi:hypothetical protein